MRKKRDHVLDIIVMSLACGSTVQETAIKAGVNKRTVYRYLEDEAFREKIQQYRVDLLYRALGLLSVAGVESVKTMLNLLDRAIVAPIRLAAACAVLDFGLRLRQATELEERMTKIEETLALQRSPPEFG